MPDRSGKSDVVQQRGGKRGITTTKALASIVAPPDRAPQERLSKGQHFEIRGDVQRISNGLSTLSGGGDISVEQATAADRWYKDYVMGVVGVRDPDAKTSGRAPDLHASMLARTAAVGRCRMVRQALGLCGEVRLKLLLVEEMSFSAIATMLLPNDSNGRKKIAAQVLLLLEQLVEIYDMLDRSRRRVPIAA